MNADQICSASCVLDDSFPGGGGGGGGEGGNIISVYSTITIVYKNSSTITDPDCTHEYGDHACILNVSRFVLQTTVATR